MSHVPYRIYLFKYVISNLKYINIFILTRIPNIAKKNYVLFFKQFDNIKRTWHQSHTYIGCKHMCMLFLFSFFFFNFSIEKTRIFFVLIHTICVLCWYVMYVEKCNPQLKKKTIYMFMFNLPYYFFFRKSSLFPNTKKKENPFSQYICDTTRKTFSLTIQFISYIILFFFFDKINSKKY